MNEILNAATVIANAATVIAVQSNALELRYLQTLTDIGESAKFGGERHLRPSSKHRRPLGN